MLGAGHLVVHRRLHREQVTAVLRPQPRERHTDLGLPVRPTFRRVRLIVLVDGCRQRHPARRQHIEQRLDVQYLVLDLDLPNEIADASLVALVCPHVAGA